MNELGCKQISIAINTIKIKYTDFVREYNNRNLDNAMTIKKEIETMIAELKELLEVSLKKAEELMNAGLTENEKKIGITNFIGPEAIGKSSFGPESIPAELPPIPFSRQELEKAGKSGQFLILRTDQIPSDKLALPNTKQTLEQPLAKRWALVTKEFIPDSMSKNYLEQTEQLIKYLQEVEFKDIEIPAEYQEAIAEFEDQKEELRPLAISTDAAVWKPVAKRLANLKITSLIRRSRDETLYDIELYKQANDQYLLPTKYEWTSSRDSDGYLVYVGDFRSGGAGVGRDRPDDSNDDLGVSFSRTH